MGVSARTRRQAHAVLQEIVDSIDHLPRPVIVKIMPVLARAQKELERDLRAWLARQDGEVRFTTQRYRNALAALRHALTAARRIEPTLYEALVFGADRAGPLAMHNLETAWLKFGQIFEGTIQPLSIDQAAIIAKGDRVLFRQFASSARRYAGSVGDDLVQELAVSRVESESIFELTNRLEKRLPHVWEGQRYRAARLARTETIEAYNLFHNEGIKAAHDEDDEIRARWDASFDFRRCPMCASLDGQVRNVAQGERFVAEWTAMTRKGPRRRRKEFSHPTAHPQCRCVETPWKVGWEEFERGRTPRQPDHLVESTARELQAVGSDG